MQALRIRVIDRTTNLTMPEALLTRSVALTQATVVRLGVWYKNRNSPAFYDEWRRSAISLQPRLSELGLIPERLWWGPMTLTPWKAGAILDEIERLRPKQMIEVGAGTSTAILAAAAHRYGINFHSLENHQGTIDYIDSLIGDLECRESVTIQKCGFRWYRSRSGRPYRWYNADLSKLNGPLDLMLIDGPMGSLIGRSGALHATMCNEFKPHHVILDDCKRKHEMECVSEWIKDYPDSAFHVTSKSGMFFISIEDENMI